MNRRALILSTTVIAVVLMSPGLFARTWTDNTGKRHFEGEFVGLADNQVDIRRADGKLVHVPMEKLSEDDQAFVGKAAKPATESKGVTSPNGEQRQTLLDQGKSFLEVKDFETALACFTQAIIQNPSNAEAYRLRAAVRKAKLGGDKSVCPRGCWPAMGPLQESLLTEAKADLAHALRVDPRNAAVLRDRADLATSPDLAIADYTSAIAINPKDAESLVGRGFSYGRQGNKERAYSDYTQAIQIDPKNVEALLYHGGMNEEMGKIDAALADFSAAIDADPKNPDPYTTRAFFYKNVKHDNDKAIQDYLQAVRLDKAGWRKAQTYRMIATLYRDMGKLDQAIATLTEAIQVLPKESQVYRERAELYKKAGKEKEHQADLDRASQLDKEQQRPTLAPRPAP